jgi:hypothetical protein
MMIGEFSGPVGQTYIMIVNLSLERSANFNLALKDAGQHLQEVSAMDDQLRPFPAGKDGFWLPAGQGILLKVQ